MPNAIRNATKKLIYELKNDRTVLLILTGLVLVDLLLISIHTFRGVSKEMGLDLGFLASPRFSLLKDQGYAEWISYAKLSIVLAVLFFVWAKTKAPVYAALAFIFLLVLIDDAMSVHEAGGHLLLYLVGRDTPLGIHVRDLGELATWAFLGAFSLVPFIYAYRRSGPEDASIAAWFAGCLAILVGFAIGTDMLHALAPTRAMDGLFGIIEDGGEILVLSLTCAIALLVFRIDRRRRIERRRLRVFAPDSEGCSEDRRYPNRRLSCPLGALSPEDRFTADVFGRW